MITKRDCGINNKSERKSNYVNYHFETKARQRSKLKPSEKQRKQDEGRKQRKINKSQIIKDKAKK